MWQNCMFQSRYAITCRSIPFSKYPEYRKGRKLLGLVKKNLCALPGLAAKPGSCPDVRLRVVGMAQGELREQRAGRKAEW